MFQSQSSVGLGHFLPMLVSALVQCVHDDSKQGEQVRYMVFFCKMYDLHIDGLVCYGHDSVKLSKQCIPYFNPGMLHCSIVAHSAAS